MKHVLLTALLLCSAGHAFAEADASGPCSTSEASLVIQTKLTTCLPHASPCTVGVIPGLSVTLSQDGATVQTAVTDAAGAIALSLAVGTYQVAVATFDGMCPAGTLTEATTCGLADVKVNAGAATALEIDYALLFP